MSSRHELSEPFQPPGLNTLTDGPQELSPQAQQLPAACHVSCVAQVPSQRDASRALLRHSQEPQDLTQPPEPLGACDGARCQAVHSDVVGTPLHSKVTGHGIWEGEQITRGMKKGEQSHSSNCCGRGKKAKGGFGQEQRALERRRAPHQT